MSSSKKVALPTQPVDLSHLAFDSTNKVDYQVKEARIRGTEVYLTSALFAEMEETWAGPFVAVKTITDEANQKVYIFPAGPKDTDDVVPLRKSETLAAAVFPFSIPMKILKLKLRKDRQIVVVPTPVPVKDRMTAYCMNLAGVRATKRPRSEAEGGAPADPKTAAEAKKSPAAAGAQSTAQV